MNFASKSIQQLEYFTVSVLYVIVTDHGSPWEGQSWIKWRAACEEQFKITEFSLVSLQMSFCSSCGNRAFVSGLGKKKPLILNLTLGPGGRLNSVLSQVVGCFPQPPFGQNCLSRPWACLPSPSQISIQLSWDSAILAEVVVAYIEGQFTLKTHICPPVWPVK